MGESGISGRVTANGDFGSTEELSWGAKEIEIQGTGDSGSWSMLKTEVGLTRLRPASRRL